MIKLDKSIPLTPEIILKIVRSHQTEELPRLKNLRKYYLAKNEINNRIMTDISKPNNKIADPYASYITDTLVGYFIGKPVSYTAADEAVMKELTMVFEYNDEADENAELAKNASIYGVAYERLYVDAEGAVRFKSLDPTNCIPVYDDTIENNLLYFIRYYQDYDIAADKDYYVVEVIDSAQVRKYQSNITLNSLSLVSEEPHYFGLVPIAIFKNNEEEMGDFERVISLIDAYDKLESDSLNDFEYFVDAYLALYGFTADSKDILEMKQNRVLLMDEGTSAEWLTKNTADNHIENIKSRLDNDIHKFSFCPNMSDENFGNNSSGVSIKFKMFGTDNIVAIKERKFKRGLQQRLELIAAIGSLIHLAFDYRMIDIVFTRNIPTNTSDIAEMVNKLQGVVSLETLLSQIPFVDDVQAELEKLKQEREENKELNPFFSSNLTYQTKAMANSTEQKNELSEEEA